MNSAEKKFAARTHSANPFSKEISDMLRLEHPYTTRPVRFLEWWEWHGWRIKVYGISARAEHPPEALVQTAREIAREKLPQPAVSESHYGVGYLIVHEGESGDYVLVDWWSNQDIVQHHLYGAPKGHEGKLDYHWPPGAGFCVWELAVCWFEREAWVETVLKHPENPDLEQYLRRTYNADV
jgi:hypothetical protein